MHKRRALLILFLLLPCARGWAQTQPGWFIESPGGVRYELASGRAVATNGITIKYDTIAPTVTHAVNPTPNADGWNKANATVHFDAADDSDGSGVDVPTITPDVVVSVETNSQVVNGQAYDLAGNPGTDSVTVKLDKTAPIINGAPTTTPNANGWYKSAVTVHFTCSDALSGVASCASDDTLTANGANQSTTGTAVDNAGNTAQKVVSGINIDSIGPVITMSGSGPPTVGEPSSLACSATDAGGAGLDGTCQVVITGGNSAGAGMFNWTATTRDLAGNVTTLTGNYIVKYRFTTFLQPINDTAHTQATMSVFKAGSTVPVKFQLRRADGTLLQSATTPQWLTPVRTGLTTAAIDESTYSDPTTSGQTFKWDPTGQQYIYTWGTSKSGANYVWRIGVKLDDGQTYTVDIGLR